MMQSVEQIREAILAGGLYDDGRPVYAEKYRPYFSATGLWQQPDELAELLHYLQQQHIRSFLNIGTFNGRTFKFIADFLTAQNPNLVCVTVDIEQHPTLVPAPEYRYVIGTSENFAHQRFDLVFIDGAHEYAAAMRDFTLVGQYAKFCVFHDIADQWISELPGGGCTAVWKELKQQCAKTHDIHEFVTADKPTQTMGLGVLAKKPLMRRIIVTPAGRQPYLQLLYQHLASQKDAFDEWHLWLNTSHEPDINFCRSLADKHNWIKTTEPRLPPNSNATIYSFFVDYVDPNCAYLRLDDDVIWLAPGFVDDMFTYRIAHPEYFLVYANIVNNSVVSHVYQRAGAIPAPVLEDKTDAVAYGVCDAVGWASPAFAHKLHSMFLASLKTHQGVDTWRCFKAWVLYYAERVSINAISWLGSEFAKFNGEVGVDEETWLSCHYPATNNMHNIIIGRPVCVHFSFYPQRGIELQHDELLAEYAKLAPFD
jgi:hypothetical protein